MTPITIAPRAGRPAERADLIVQELRGQIVGGELPPGSRLPTRLEIEQKFGASTNTVQRALERLKRDGFVTANGRNGTFVSHAPPHLTRYGLVFPHLPQDLAWVRFWTALSQEAIRVEHCGDLKLPQYFGVETHKDSPEVFELWRQVREHQLAGLIIAAPLPDFLNTPLWSEPGIPRALIGPVPTVSDVPNVDLDNASFVKKAAQYLRENGRSRPARVIPMQSSAWLEMEEKAWAAEGFESRPYWRQIAFPDEPISARLVTHLLMECKDRPDSLVITDDNLVEQATAGLMASGVRVPEDITVVAHCNFPWPTPSLLPVKRLGFDARQVLRACIDLIDAQRRGEAVPDGVCIPALFEEEVEASR
jgi:hypothetical protein